MRLHLPKSQHSNYYTTKEVASILGEDTQRITRIALRFRIEKFAGQYLYGKEDIERIREYIRKVDAL